MRILLLCIAIIAVASAAMTIGTAAATPLWHWDVKTDPICRNTLRLEGSFPTGISGLVAGYEKRTIHWDWIDTYAIASVTSSATSTTFAFADVEKRYEPGARDISVPLARAFTEDCLSGGDVRMFRIDDDSGDSY